METVVRKERRRKKQGPRHPKTNGPVVVVDFDAHRRRARCSRIAREAYRRAGIEPRTFALGDELKSVAIELGFRICPLRAGEVAPVEDDIVYYRWIPYAAAMRREFRRQFAKALLIAAQEPAGYFEELATELASLEGEETVARPPRAELTQMVSDIDRGILRLYRATGDADAREAIDRVDSAIHELAELLEIGPEYADHQLHVRPEPGPFAGGPS